jgi:hypothetical protein
MSSARATIARQFLRAVGLPRIEPSDVLALPFLQWLAEARGFLFHGSIRDDLAVLEPIRQSRDATPFGDQQAVYASSDPIWAIYFAILRRDNGFVGTRNGSVALVGGAVYPRWYFFSINRDAPRQGRSAPGTIDVVPREPFRPEEPE